MNSAFKTALIACVCLGLAGPILAEEVDNPQYLHWSQFKEGTAVTLKNTIKQPEMSMETKMTMTLKTLDDTRAVITISTDMMGMQQTQEQIIPAKIEEEQIPENNPDAEVTTGEETVTVPAGTFECKWTQVEMVQDGQKVVSKVWSNETVPGGMVKNETKMEEMTSTMELLKMDKK